MTFADRLAPSALLVLPDVETENFGANLRVAQFVTWNGTARVELAPWVLVIAPPTLQLVAVRGVERKPRTVDVEVDAPEFDRDAGRLTIGADGVDERRERVGDVGHVRVVSG